MKLSININISDRTLAISILTVLSLFIISGILAQVPLVDQTKPYHPLQQIAKSVTNLETVDADGNGIIDYADNITIEVPKTGGTKKTLQEAIDEGDITNTSLSYLGYCVAHRGEICKCYKGETIMLIMGNTAGSGGYCGVRNQGTPNVEGYCDPSSAPAG
ncbi:hypothetical protein DRQ17_04850, partial [bacterium]